MKRFIFPILSVLLFISIFFSTAQAQAPTTGPFDVSNNCTQSPTGGYTTLEACFKALESALPQTTPTKPLTASGSPFCEVGDGVFLDTCDITESTKKVIVRFYGFRNPENGPDGQGKYFCYKSDQSKCEKDNFKEIKRTIEGGGVIEEEVCGDGKDALMGKNHKRGGGCKTSDYFHQGKFYRLGIYYDKDKNTKLGEAAFYIKHFYPIPTVEPKKPVEKASITVRLSGIRESENQSGDNQNNYKILLQSRDDAKFGEKSKCITIPQDKKEAEETFTGLARGKYQIKIQERVGEDGSNCKGGFTYWTIPVTVGDLNFPGKVGEPISDPNNVESRQQSQNSGPLPPPCAEKDRTPDGRCLAIQTGIGRISVQPDTFVSSLYGWLLTLASVAGFILLIRAGYKLLTSAGNKEKVGEAREEIKSVIFGILFLVVALVMLEAIGTDILKIPGFVR